MKTIRLAAASFIFAALFAVSAFAQVPAQPGANIKVMFINTGLFEAKDGITRYINAMNLLNREMEPLRADIRTMVTRHDTLAKEMEQIQTQATTATAAVKDTLERQFIAKRDEVASLEIQIKRKQEDGKARFERREGEVMGPVRLDIGKGLEEFAKQRGYSVIFDVTKLGPAILVYDAAKADVTKEFITFYNARATPAGTAL
jgi:Skp family chaperone for outer membrane proteins